MFKKLKKKIKKKKTFSNVCLRSKLTERFSARYPGISSGATAEPKRVLSALICCGSAQMFAMPYRCWPG